MTAPHSFTQIVTPDVPPGAYAARIISRDLLVRFAAHCGAADVTNEGGGLDIDWKKPSRCRGDEVAEMGVAREYDLNVAGAISTWDLGSGDLFAWRFTAAETELPYSLVWITRSDLDRAVYPVVVDGHLVDGAETWMAWLGEADASDHPDLVPPGSLIRDEEGSGPARG